MVEFNKNVKGKKLMNENLLKVLSLYCNNEIENLKNSELYIKIQKLVDELNYILVCEYGTELDDKKSENLYLSITIFNDKNEVIEIFDDGFLKFLSWQDEEFIEDLNWLNKKLENIKNNK